MDDAVLVRGFERVGNLPGDAAAPRRAGSRRLRDAIGERRPLDQLHHERAFTPPDRLRRRRSPRCSGDSARRASGLRARIARAARASSAKASGRTLIATSRCSLRRAPDRPRPCRRRRWRRRLRTGRGERRAAASRQSVLRIVCGNPRMVTKLAGVRDPASRAQACLQRCLVPWSCVSLLTATSFSIS